MADRATFVTKGFKLSNVDPDEKGDLDKDDAKAALDAACGVQEEWAATPANTRYDILQSAFELWIASLDRKCLPLSGGHLLKPTDLGIKVLCAATSSQKRKRSSHSKKRTHTRHKFIPFLRLSRVFGRSESRIDQPR